MSLADLMRKGGLRAFATATPATVATLEAIDALTVAEVATVAVAKSPDSKAANDPAPDPDRWCWPHSEAMNTAEIEIFIVRLSHFTSRDAASAEALADRLIQRDREADNRCLCADCRYCHPGPYCRQGLAVVNALQRCDLFARHPALETDRPDGGDGQ